MLLYEQFTYKEHANTNHKHPVFRKQAVAANERNMKRASELDELLAETYAAEPLTWLEAAVFFLFACAEYPEETERWAPLARQRWERYLASAHIVDVGGEATLALARSRAASQALRI